MTLHHINNIRFTVGEYVYYSMRGWTCGDDSAADIRRSAFQIIRSWIKRGKSLDEALCHILGLAVSASLA